MSYIDVIFSFICLFCGMLCVYFSASFLTKTINVDDQVYKYQIWDTAGQEKVLLYLII